MFIRVYDRTAKKRQQIMISVRKSLRQSHYQSNMKVLREKMINLGMCLSQGKKNIYVSINGLSENEVNQLDKENKKDEETQQRLMEERDQKNKKQQQKSDQKYFEKLGDQKKQEQQEEKGKSGVKETKENNDVSVEKKDQEK